MAGLAGLVCTPVLLAQDASTAATAPTSASSPGRVIVTDTPIEDSVLPTVRPFSAAFGIDSNILDIPRNVTVISREQLDTIAIFDVRDFAKLTSSSYTPSNFGAPSNPSIRGQTADVFVNGMRRGLTSNGNGLPVNFNSIESVDIIKGPPTVILGVSQYTGGSINLNTKRPYFDKFQGQVGATFGSYGQYLYNADFGGPIIKDKLAFRVSFSGEESGSYYENGHQYTQAIYTALTWTPSANYTLDFNFEGFWADYTENFGINRPTQDLIDHGRYITGTVGLVNGVQDNSIINGGFNTVTPGPTINLNRSVRLLAPGDGSGGHSFNAQVIQTLKLNETFSIVNNTFFYYVNRGTYSSYYYSEILDSNFAIANRTEFRLNYDFLMGQKATTVTGKDGKAVTKGSDGWHLKLSINAGIELRYQQVNAYNDYFNEPANAWDLSLPRSQINYINQAANGSLSLAAFGHPGRFASPGVFNGDTNQSRAFTISPYFQQEMKFGPMFGLLFGARVDILFVRATDPLAPSFAAQNTDSTVMGIPNFNVSPTFSPFPWLTTYFTYNYSQSTGVANGGGYMMGGNTLGTFASSYFHQVSELYEFGAKASLLKNTLFISSAAFHQTRIIPSNTNAGVINNKLTVNGFEIEANYQPTKNFWITASYTLLDAIYKDQVPFSVQSYPFDQIGNNFNLTDTFGALSPYAKGNYRQPGLPKNQFNALIQYKLDCGLGASIGAVVTGPQNLNFDGSVKIRTQYTLDASIFYRQKRYELVLSVLNLTDQKNWSPPNSVYANDSVVANLPIRVNGTVRFKF
ncbi:hypothetical protein AYO41_03860 [Verrucomicrobia bacterium SCGC AG-212-E04]|nr:hypothetical protein AYO41_03860 [Verrucomicrobia bacterium SCGC AG-212-E04]